MLKRVVLAAALVVGVLGVAAGPATALSERWEYRGSCAYFIESYAQHVNSVQAEPQACLGRVSTEAIVGGVNQGRVFGDNRGMSLFVPGGNVTGGHHWGCDACAVWTT